MPRLQEKFMIKSNQNVMFKKLEPNKRVQKINKSLDIFHIDDDFH